MSITFPTTLDTLPNPTSTDLMENATLALDHDQQHANANDAIEALEAKVGINGSAVTTSHDYKLSAVTGSAKALTAGTSTQSVTGLTLVNPVLTIGSDATGDIYYRNSGGALVRLPIGTAGQILQVSSGGIPEYIGNPAAADASTTTKGVVEIATTAQITAGTGTGETGAILVVPASAVGTAGASKLVQFDGTGKYPAADGSAITNIPLPFSKVSTVTMSAVSLTTATLTKVAEFTGLTGDADDTYELVFEGAFSGVAGSGAYISLRLNDSTGSNYTYKNIYMSTSTITANAGTATTNGFPLINNVGGTNIIRNVFGELKIKSTKLVGGTIRYILSNFTGSDSDGSTVASESGAGSWADTSNEITSIQVYAYQNSGGTLTYSGKVSLYKINR